MGMRFKISRRQNPRRLHSGLVLLAAVGLSLVICALLLEQQGKPSLRGLILLFKGAFGSGWALQDSLIKAVPIFLCSLGVAIAFRLQIWNIGAEGQYALGALGASWVALHFPDLPWFVLQPAMLVAATVCGGLWGLLPAVLKLRMRANEIIITLMLNYIAIFLLDYLVYGPWKDPSSFGFPMTRMFSQNAVVAKIGASDLHWGILLCLVIGMLVWIFLGFTRLGYEIRACGENVQAARYARMPYAALVLLVMAASGALAGWAGFLEASASLNRLEPSIMAGYGYTAIVVAWLARLNPLFIGLAAFLLAGLRVGVEQLQLDLQIPASFGQIMEGLILLTVLGGSFFVTYQIRLLKKE